MSAATGSAFSCSTAKAPRARSMPCDILRADDSKSVLGSTSRRVDPTAFLAGSAGEKNPRVDAVASKMCVYGTGTRGPSLDNYVALQLDFAVFQSAAQFRSAFNHPSARLLTSPGIAAAYETRTEGDRHQTTVAVLRADGRNFSLGVYGPAVSQRTLVRLARSVNTRLNG